MKKATIVFVLSVLASTPSFADTMADMRACMATEQEYSDASRGGISASEFCAAQAVIENSQPDPVDTAISWLSRKNAEDPAATQAAMDSCRTGVGQTHGELLSCMMRILGP